MDKKLVSVVIVTWNSGKTLHKCLAALRQQTYDPLEVIVIDNASADDSIDVVRRELPSARIISNTSNEGYCAAHNTGIRLARGEFHLPLNPDVEMSPAFVANLVQACGTDKAIGIVAGKLHLPLRDGETGLQLIDGAGLFVNKARRQFLRGHGEPDRGQYDTGDYVFGSCGAAPLYRREMLEDTQIGGEFFDEAFFAHKEDFDLSWRAQLLGWRAWYEPSATAEHDRGFRPTRRGMMAREVKVHAVKNRYLTIVKNDLVSNILRHITAIAVYDLKIIGYLCLFETSSLMGLVRFIALSPSALQKREIIMRRRRVNASYMRSFFR